MLAPLRSVGVQTVIHVNRPHPQSARPIRSQRRKERRRINSATEGNDEPDIGEARQQVSQVGRKPLWAERLRGPYSGFSENTPKDAMRAERAARSSSRGMASS